MINTVVGEYFLVQQELGSDTFGTVYLGRDTRFTTEIHPVAVRVLDPKFTNIVGFAARFQAIAPRLVSWNQRYITRTLAQGVISDRKAGTETFYLISEVPSTVTLDAYLKQHARHFQPEQIARLLDKLAAAVEWAHKENIYHGNLNSWNITMRGEDPEIADFGLLQMLLPYDLNQLRQTTRWKTAVGVPEFIAPERFRGEPPGKANDIYGLGVVLYLMLAGRMPFTGTYDELVVAHSYQQPAAIVGIPKALDLTAFLQKVLNKVIGDRPTVPDIPIRYRQIMGLPRTMLPIFDQHPSRVVPVVVEDEPAKKRGWFGKK